MTAEISPAINCLDYYNDKCNSLTHTCEHCPDRQRAIDTSSNLTSEEYSTLTTSALTVGAPSHDGRIPMDDYLDDLLMKRFEFSTLTEANIHRQAEWDPTDAISHSYRGNELAGELGEALEKATLLLLASGKLLNLCNLIKKIDREHLGLRGTRVDMSEVAKEFGDVQICLNLASIKLGFNLEQETKDKFNETSIKYGLKTRYV